MIQTKECSRDTDVQQVQLVDLEDTVHLPPGRATMGIQVGNWMWRSPEAHAQGPVEKSSDMFSFGLVVSTLLSCPQIEEIEPLRSAFTL